MRGSLFNSRAKLISVGVVVCVIALVLSVIRINSGTSGSNPGSYSPLIPDISTENPLQYITEDFKVLSGFHTNLPIVILSIDGKMPEYKHFINSKEVVNEDVEPYTTGVMEIIDGGDNDNHLSDPRAYKSNIKLKKRGHTSIVFDKPQYKIKAFNGDGSNNDTSILGMGEGNDWILNGSLADKSMIRNYLGYRVSSEVGGNNFSPDARFCEVLLKEGEDYTYHGVFLLSESIDAGRERVNIKKTGNSTKFSSYIIRRDRQTAFDIMLNTYGRINGLSPEYIGLKYPGQKKLTNVIIDYIERDFSRTEKIIYSDNMAEYKVYKKYIDTDSFADYFLINEFFGNYDAGEHSTYMYKNSGEILKIGPVWDFDQAMNNYSASEMDTETIAFQTKPLYNRLTLDRAFIDKLKDRYTSLRKTSLSEEHIFDLIDETTAYLRSARTREWFRYGAQYTDKSYQYPGNYYLQGYVLDGIAISRLNDKYDQELYNIRNYIHKHGIVIEECLTALYDSAKYDTAPRSYNTYFLILLLAVFIIPSIIINQRG